MRTSKVRKKNPAKKNISKIYLGINMVTKNEKQINELRVLYMHGRFDSIRKAIHKGEKRYLVDNVFAALSQMYNEQKWDAVNRVNEVLKHIYENHYGEEKRVVPSYPDCFSCVHNKTKRTLEVNCELDSVAGSCDSYEEFLTDSERGLKESFDKWEEEIKEDERLGRVCKNCVHHYYYNSNPKPPGVIGFCSSDMKPACRKGYSMWGTNCGGFQAIKKSVCISCKKEIWNSSICPTDDGDMCEDCFTDLLCYKAQMEDLD
jgi:hypothetical protein